VLKELGTSPQAASVVVAQRHLFDLNPKNLNSNEELKRMFGADIVSFEFLKLFFSNFSEVEGTKKRKKTRETSVATKCEAAWGRPAHVVPPKKDRFGPTQGNYVSEWRAEG
jgi:hypothetical protein